MKTPHQLEARDGFGLARITEIPGSARRFERTVGPYSREKIFVGAYEKHDGTKVRGHFRKAPRRHLF